MKAAFSSLRARVALLVLLALVPVLVLSIYNNLQQRRLAGQRAGDEALGLVRLATGNEAEIVEGTSQLLIALAQLPQIHSGDTAGCNDLFARIREQNRRYANIGAIDANGDVFCSALPYSGAVSLTDRNYFRQAFDRGEFFTGEYQIGRITDRPTLNFGYPVHDEQGNVHAVVFAALDLNWLDELATGLALNGGTVLFTVDRQGAILTHYPDGARWIGQTPDSDLIDTILTRRGEGTIEMEGLDGALRLYAYAPLDADRDTGVYVSAGIPTSVAYAAANRDLARNLGTLSLFTLLFLAVAWSFADRFVLRPVQGMARASDRLSSGEMGARTDVPYDDSELGRLAHSFDKMALSMESRLRRLQALNAIDRAITARYDMAQTLDVVLEQAVSRLEVDAAAIFLLNEKSGVLEFVSGRGFRDPALAKATLTLDESYSGHVAQERQVLYIADLRQADHLKSPHKAAEGFISYCGAPLFSEGQLQGVLSMYHRSELAMEEEWKSFFEAVALQAAIAVDNARLLRETRRLLEVTREQARQVQQIVDTLPEGVVLLATDHRVLLANPLGSRYLADLAGAADGDVLSMLGGRPLPELLQPVGEDEPWHELALPSENQIFEVASQPVRHEDQVGGWVLVLRNVTEERERQEYMGTQNRLATVGQLAAGIAHDFNNIMAIILLYGQTLSRREDHPRRADYLETIVSQAQRASQLINQILDFSRAGSIERQRLQLVPFVKETARLLRRTLSESITVIVQHDGDLDAVEADATRLQQVLMNLAINARDAMPQGGRLTIAVSSRRVAPGENPPLPDMEPGQYVVISVSDTGSGIPPHIQKRIFEPFFTTKPRGQGTGLGLAQVYGIVRQHHGAIDVQSQPGQGTTFTFYLPALAPQAPTDDAREAESAHSAGAGLILLVEDNAMTRGAISDTLAELGYRVLEAENGLQALEMLQQQPGVDLVLSDIVMPEMDGIALQEALRETFPHVSFLLMSGYPLARDEQQEAPPPEVSHLRKPFTSGQLARNIERLLNEDGAG